MPPFLVHGALLLAPVFVAALWQSTLLALATATLLRLLPALSATSRSRIWTAAFLLAAVLPFTALLPAASRSLSRGGFHATYTFACALAFVWWATFIMRANQLFRSALHLHRLARRATPKSVFDGIPVCTCTEISVPSVAGFSHPRILIPAALYTTLSPEDLHLVLLHESEHLRRRDDWTNLVQKLALVVFPISPALLWMERRLCLERELACDDGVLRVSGTPRAYATTLANLAEHGFLHRSLSLALGAIRHRSEVARRIHRILARPAAQLAPRRAALVSGFTVTILLAAAVTFARVPALVLFTSSPVTAAMREPVSFAPALRTAPGATVARPILASFQVGKLSPVRRPHVHVVHRTKPTVEKLNAPVILRTSFELPESQALPVLRITRVRFTSDSALPQFPVFTLAAVPVRTGWLILQL